VGLGYPKCATELQIRRLETKGSLKDAKISDLMQQHTQDQLELLASAYMPVGSSTAVFKV
jgi:hypothetical protein